MAIIAIESNAVRVEIDPAFGARVLSLIDRRSGRDWIAKGPQSTQIGEEAMLLANEAVGWDECFPTVAPWDATGTPWAATCATMVTSGGRPWTVDAQSSDSLTTSRSDGAFRFRAPPVAERGNAPRRLHSRQSRRSSAALHVGAARSAGRHVR